MQTLCLMISSYSLLIAEQAPLPHQSPCRTGLREGCWGLYWVRVQMLREIRTALQNPYTHQMPFRKSVYASIRHLRTLFVRSARSKLTSMAQEEEAYRRRLERQKTEATAVELSLGAGVVGARTSMAREVVTVFW